MIFYVNGRIRPAGIRIFCTQSPRHFEEGDWDQGSSCQRVQPLLPEQVYRFFSLERNGTSADTRCLANQHMYKVLEGPNFHILDVSHMSECRADPHPSTAGGKKHSDYMHWCLPRITIDNKIGFWSATASNVTFQSRNVLSKKFMVNKKGLNAKDVSIKALIAGICFHAYQQGYEILHFCLTSYMTDEEINKGIHFPSISSIRHITTKVGAAVVRGGVVEELAEGHGNIGTKQLMHMLEEGTKEYVARSMWYPFYHPFVHEK
ncbi:hypothetical protein GIB67_019073 [Kingdonia uniflora]|uniref:Trichome birefringence-like C-terminal domain-containing protein n=1 Tax=Kingdonia uniflora TaxID=39325 RepID=A0A7J7MZR4_9MAGN|nr:hypothetical protein GIB67_019073 [Kingdonia uniflora]